jgi:hypothetical protein
MSFAPLTNCTDPQGSSAARRIRATAIWGTTIARVLLAQPKLVTQLSGKQLEQMPEYESAAVLAYFS